MKKYNLPSKRFVGQGKQKKSGREKTGERAKKKIESEVMYPNSSVLFYFIYLFILFIYCSRLSFREARTVEQAASVICGRLLRRQKEMWPSWIKVWAMVLPTKKCSTQFFWPCNNVLYQLTARLMSCPVRKFHFRFYGSIRRLLSKFWTSFRINPCF